MAKISYFEQNATCILVVCTAFYTVFFTVWHLNSIKTIELVYLTTLFNSPITVIAFLFCGILSFINFGRVLVQENVEQARHNALKAIENKKQELADYIILAKLLTKNDASKLVDEYLAKLKKSV